MMSRPEVAHRVDPGVLPAGDAAHAQALRDMDAPSARILR
jgi:hypothetical protein